MLLGILIFWGIAATSYRGSHITVDLVWSVGQQRWQRVIDVFATLVLLFVVTVQTIMLFDKVRTTYADNVLTYDLHLPTWPFFAVAWLGDVSAVLLIAIRTYRLTSTRPARAEDSRDEPCERCMSTDAIAILGFVALFALMLLRVPVGMAMGLVGVTGFGLIVGPGPALKLVGQTSMRTVTDYTFGVIPMFLLMGAFVSASGMSRELFRAANAFVGHLRGGLGIRHHRRLRRLCRDLRLVGRDGGDLLDRRLSGDAPLRLSAVLLDRRDRRRRHARRDAAALDRARGLRRHHPAGHRQAVHGRHPARACSRSRCTCSPSRSSASSRPDFLPAGAARRWAERAGGVQGRLGAAAAVRVRHRRPLRRPLHADRGRRHGRGRRLPPRRAARTAEPRRTSAPRCCRRRARRRRCSRC